MSLAADLEALGVLVEPQRRRLYEHLLAAAEPASPSDLAAALGVGRTLLTFHLGKLVDAGFVEVLAPGLPAGRRGRPSQRYIAAQREVAASAPTRHYALIAEVLLEAATTSGPLKAAALRIARRRGALLADVEPALPAGRGLSGRLGRVERLLARLGYAPRREQRTVVLANCPFDRLRAANADLVCGINHALAEGYLEGLGLDDALTATLRPSPSACCVVVSPAS